MVGEMQHDAKASPVAVQDFGAILGTPFKVFLGSGVTHHIDSVTGKLIHDIDDLSGLIAAVVQSRALHPRKLSGADLKYIRSALCLRSHEVATALELTPEHYSRCENGTKTLSPEKEKFYRMYVWLGAIWKDKNVKEKLSKEVLLRESMKPSTPEKAKQAMNAFLMIFMEMKIDAAYCVDHELEFSFYRRGSAAPKHSCKTDEKAGKERLACSNDNADWLRDDGLDLAYGR